MERARAFTAVPGAGGVLMGILATIAALAARAAPTPRDWALVWLACSLPASAVAVLSIAAKSRRQRGSAYDSATARFLAALLPPLIAGTVLTFALMRAQAYEWLAGVWLTLYGAAAASAAGAAIAPVRSMGAAFIALGAAALFTPPSWGNLWMALGFGGLQVGFGVYIWRRFDG